MKFLVYRDDEILIFFMKKVRRTLVRPGVQTVRWIIATKRKIEFVKKSAGAEKRNREIGSFFSLRTMGAL